VCESGGSAQLSARPDPVRLPSLTSVEKSHNWCAQRGSPGEEGSVPAGQDSVPTVFDTGGPAQSGSTQATARWQAAASRLTPYARMSQNGGEDHDLVRDLVPGRGVKPHLDHLARRLLDRAVATLDIGGAAVPSRAARPMPGRSPGR